jgi:hypothetical protein
MKKVFKIIIISLILTSCQATKDTLTLKKKSSADEFLVEKKSPLVLPPEYGKLPIPEKAKINEKQSSENEDIQLLIGIDKKTLTNKVEKNSKPTSIENSILKKIK